MLKKRLIPVLILRDGQVVRSVKFNHTNIIHWKPETAVDFFNKWSVDEIIVLDANRELKDRDQFYDVIDSLSKECFVPLTAGGWVTTVDEMQKLLRLGADKVTINTQAFRNPDFITECAESFGSQCVVVSIDSKQTEDGTEEVYIDRGREPTGVTPVEWARTAQEKGAGEIFLTSIDHDGNKEGYNLPLMKSVSEAVDIPVIAMGGVFEWDHLYEGIEEAGVDAVAAANVFHFTEHSTKKAKEFLRDKDVNIR